MNINVAIRVALKEVKRSRHRQHKLSAVILKGSNIVSTGWNFSHTHAEHTAINRAWRTDIHGATLVVMRLRRDGKIGMARPCPRCLAKIIEAGIKRCIYTDNNGCIVEINLRLYTVIPYTVTWNGTICTPDKIAVETI